MPHPFPRPQNPHLAVKRGLSGLGIFATGPIKKNSFVIEYWGEVVSEDVANERGGKYLFELDHDKAIDGSTRKNIARYINHSCRANCEPREVGDRIFIYSTRAIKAGEELTYDYGKAYWNDHIKPVGCRCDSCSKRAAKKPGKTGRKQGK